MSVSNGVLLAATIGGPAVGAVAVMVSGLNSRGDRRNVRGIAMPAASSANAASSNLAVPTSVCTSRPAGLDSKIVARLSGRCDQA